MKDKTLRNFWAKVNKNGPGECWEWKGAFSGPNRNYGHMKIEGKYKKAHRISYELAYGAIPSGLKVCHKCDNPKCLNPQHLFIGTQGDNIRDCVKKGRLRNYRPPFAPINHGTVQQYWRGCHCDQCKRANTKYGSNRRERLKSK